MLSNEEYQRTTIHMWDSLRSTHKGEQNCEGVVCETCPFKKLRLELNGCCGAYMNAVKAIEIVEQWGKDHPILTRFEKFKEVFGREPRYYSTGTLMCPRTFTNDDMGCNGHLCAGCCEKFWDGEYVPPKKEEPNE